MSVSPQKQAASEALAGPEPFAGGIRIAEKLVLLTHDESLIEALASVVPPDSLLVVADEAALANHLLSGHAGVVFIDASAAPHSHPGATAQLAQRLHLELPDVVLIVTGAGPAQSELAALISDGTIYRFVHKPVSAQRVKLFVDAAWRRHSEGQSGGPPGATGTADAQPAAGRNLLVLGTAVAAAAVLGGLFLSHKPGIPAGVGTPAAPVAASDTHNALLEEDLARAEAAFAQGKLVAPPGANAVDWYRQARQDRKSVV